MFILYMADIADLVAKHQLNFHSFADDSQIYLHCRISDASSAVSKPEDCISIIGHWMSANRLKLNADKTELPSASLYKFTFTYLLTGGSSLKQRTLYRPRFWLTTHQCSEGQFLTTMNHQSINQS